MSMNTPFGNTWGDGPLREINKFCKDCKWCNYDGNVKYLSWKCMRPRKWSELNVVNGETYWREEPARTCIMERTAVMPNKTPIPGYCGTNAIHFQPKQTT